MHMFDTAWQLATDRQQQLRRAAEPRHGRRSALRHPVRGRPSE